MTDVITTAGVLIGIVLVMLTGWQRLDPLIALIVAANILFMGVKLLRHAALGLMDAALPEVQLKEIQDVLQPYDSKGVQFHALRTRSAAARGFVSMHILVPGTWTVHDAHHLAEDIEADIRQKNPNVAVFTHIEPIDDPISFQDTTLDRE
jgi:cation diffusion facilitator family transporter